jgi:hypothetical protein
MAGAIAPRIGFDSLPDMPLFIQAKIRGAQKSDVYRFIHISRNTK